MVVLYICVAVTAICGLVRWWLYLRLCRHVFDATQDPKALAHVAAPARAYREFPLRLPGRGG